MTIDEKIKQAADKASLFCKCKGIVCHGCERTIQISFIQGANFLKSEMLADMQKMVDALEKIYKVECKQQSCSIAARAISRQALAEFNAKYKGLG